MLCIVSFKTLILLCRISDSLSAERLQLLQNKKKHYENQQDKIKQEVGSHECHFCLMYETCEKATFANNIKKLVAKWTVDYVGGQELLFHVKCVVIWLSSRCCKI